MGTQLSHPYTNLHIVIWIIRLNLSPLLQKQPTGQICWCVITTRKDVPGHELDISGFLE